MHHEKSKNNPPHKCLIFAQHRQTLDIIENCVLLRYFPTINYKKLDGSVPPIVRAQWAQKFNQADVEENFQKNAVVKKKEKLKSISVDGNVECIEGNIVKEKIKIGNQIVNKNNNENVYENENDDENRNENKSENDDEGNNCLESFGQGREQKRSSERGEYALNDLRILLMTTRSCGLGLNLTAADTVIL